MEPKPIVELHTFYKFYIQFCCLFPLNGKKGFAYETL